MADHAPPIAADATAAERSCADVTTGEARYLMALYDMQREAGSTDTSQASLARHLKVSAPTAFEMLRRLRLLGLVEADVVRHTPAGMSAGLVLSSRRRAALAIMCDVLGMDEAHADSEAAWLAASASPLLGRHLVAWRAHGDDARGHYSTG